MTERPSNLWKDAQPIGSSAKLPSQDILGVDVVDLSMDDALAFVYDRLALKQFTPITFLNAHNGNIAQRDGDFAKALKEFTVFADGVGVDIAAKILYGKKFNANLNGTDFIPALFKSSPHPLKVALYGAKPGVAEEAAAAFSQMDDRHEIRVAGHGFIDQVEQRAMLDELCQWKPDVVLVAKGVPNQESWIRDNLTADHCTLAFGIGALFDFSAGRVPRAPQWMRATRIEWIFRLILEPKRMWRRYIVGNPLFLVHVIKQKLD